MLFNSYVFVFAFLPLTLLGFWLASRSRQARVGVWWLNAASLTFYAWWAPAYTALLLGSVVVNFGLGRALGAKEARGLSRKSILVAGIVINLAALAYYKYANFFVDTLTALTGAGLTLAPIVLPLGISFFTFTQIAYLVDTYERPQESEGTFGEYLLFVVFFPHLLAGPIVHHGQLMPQMKTEEFRQLRSQNLVLGGAVFLVGLGKKVLLADSFVVLVGPVFSAADAGQSLSLVEAWVGALAYTLQLYFDFSGYSDMAIGLARMFGIHFPRNFDSPYKATSIVDFWRRWHMTLSAFLRDYLYVRLGGNRKGPARRYLNLFLTMLLGGLWHGAGWTFVLWGALHGIYLVINHAVNALRARLGWGAPGAFARLAAGGITFLAVVVGWVFFRATTVGGAGRILTAMVGGSEIMLPEKAGALLGQLGLAAHVTFGPLTRVPLPIGQVAIMIAFGLAVVWLAPNSGQLFERQLPEPVKRGRAPVAIAHRWYHFNPSLLWAVGLGVLLTLSLAAVAGKTEFIYFQF